MNKHLRVIGEEIRKMSKSTERSLRVARLATIQIAAMTLGLIMLSLVSIPQLLPFDFQWYWFSLTILIITMAIFCIHGIEKIIRGEKYKERQIFSLVGVVAGVMLLFYVVIKLVFKI